MRNRTRVLFENLNYDTFKTLIYELLKGDNVIVIDEFQRSPEDFAGFLLHIGEKS